MIVPVSGYVCYVIICYLSSVLLCFVDSVVRGLFNIMDSERRVAYRHQGCLKWTSHLDLTFYHSLVYQSFVFF